MYAIHTYISTMVRNQIPYTGAENTRWLILFQNHFIIIQIDLQLIPLGNIQGAPKLYRKHNSPQFINFTNNTG